MLSDHRLDSLRSNKSYYSHKSDRYIHGCCVFIKIFYLCKLVCVLRGKFYYKRLESIIERLELSNSLGKRRGRSVVDNPMKSVVEGLNKAFAMKLSTFEIN